MNESTNSVINAATVIAVRHEKRELIRHEEWKELKESLAGSTNQSKKRKRV